MCAVKYYKDSRILTMALSNDNLKDFFPYFVFLFYFINFVISKFCMSVDPF